MIAEAVKAVVLGAGTVQVDLQTIRFTDPKKPFRYAYLTPRIAQVFLIDFDEGRTDIEPFSFKLKRGMVTAVQRGNHSGKRGPEQLVLGDKSTKTGPPRRVGGKMPPRGRPAARREFGLKAYRR
jgi:hypothetical protein